MDQLREGIGLRAYGQKNPLNEYKKEGYEMFMDMMYDINTETLKRIFRTNLVRAGEQATRPCSLQDREDGHAVVEEHAASRA